MSHRKGVAGAKAQASCPKMLKQSHPARVGGMVARVGKPLVGKTSSLPKTFPKHKLSTSPAGHKRG